MNCNGNGQREARATKKLTLTTKAYKSIVKSRPNQVERKYIYY